MSKTPVVEGHFSCALEEFHPLFFTQLGLDLSQVVICLTLPEQTALYREKFFERLKKKSLKNISTLYQASLFPFDEDKTSYETQLIPQKEGVLLKAGAINRSQLSEFIDELSTLGITPDYLTVWPHALQTITTLLCRATEPYLLFYQRDSVLFVLENHLDKINFATSIRLPLKSPYAPSSALQALKHKYQACTLKTWLVIENPQLKTDLFTHFPLAESPEVLNQNAPWLIPLGCALASKNKQLNFAPKSKRLDKNLLSRLLGHLSVIQFTGALLFFVFSLGILGLGQYRLNKGLQLANCQEVPAVITEAFLKAQIEDLKKLSILEPWVPQVASVGEILAFLATHPVLNLLDERSKKNTSFQYFEYTLIQPQKAHIQFSCRFPAKEIQNLFETDLKTKKITFQKTEHLQLTQYDFEIGKNFKP